MQQDIEHLPPQMFLTIQWKVPSPLITKHSYNNADITLSLIVSFGKLLAVSENQQLIS